MYSKGQGGTAWAAEPLPRGRHKLDRDQVIASQRERIMRAMLESVAADGYGATTVPRVAAAARVSPNTFYRFFSDKVDCFLAVCDEQAIGLISKLAAAGAEPTWEDAVRAGTTIYLEHWREHPAVSRAYLVELPTAGFEAMMQRQATHRRFLGLFEGLAARARTESPGLPPVSQVELRLLIAGMTELVAEEVREGRLEALHELEDDLNALVIRFIGGGAA